MTAGISLINMSISPACGWFRSPMTDCYRLMGHVKLMGGLAFPSRSCWLSATDLADVGVVRFPVFADGDLYRFVAIFFQTVWELVVVVLAAER